MQKTLETGTLLIAEPFIWDYHFRRSVILLTEHHLEGSHGFILNKPIGMNVTELVQSFPEFDAPVYYGGPVSTDTLHFLHTVGDLISDSHLVLQGLWWGGSYEDLQFLVENKLIQPKDIRFYVGYSGWEQGQLFQEISDVTWVVGAGDINYVFAPRPQTLWRDALRRQGDTLGVIGDMPDEQYWN